jgi:hypothetical protein
LFRSLFRGRENVDPRCVESRSSGKSGYSPVCANEWVRGVCEKLQIKCTACRHWNFLPVTDDVIRKLTLTPRTTSAVFYPERASTAHWTSPYLQRQSRFLRAGIP